MTKEKQLTKEEKIEKAKKLTKELKDLQLTPEELEQIAGGITGGYDQGLVGMAGCD